MRKLRLDELGRPSVEEYRQQPKLPVVIVLDSIRSALNVGSIFRTADAFAVQRIILTGITATPPHREIQKTAIGATESVRWQYEKNVLDAIESLRNDGYRCYLVEQTDRSRKLGTFALSAEAPVALVFGNEVDGVAGELVKSFDESIEIPQYGTKHSLNVAVSVGILLWEITRNVAADQ
jgi:23S rRNA (guanosine2251-2'-O)-methyltransferase